MKENTQNRGISVVYTEPFSRDEKDWKLSCVMNWITNCFGFFVLFDEIQYYTVRMFMVDVLRCPEDGIAIKVLIVVELAIIFAFLVWQARVEIARHKKGHFFLLTQGFGKGGWFVERFPIWDFIFDFVTNAVFVFFAYLCIKFGAEARGWTTSWKLVTTILCVEVVLLFYSQFKTFASYLRKPVYVHARAFRRLRDAETVVSFEDGEYWVTSNGKHTELTTFLETLYKGELVFSFSYDVSYNGNPIVVRIEFGRDVYSGNVYVSDTESVSDVLKDLEVGVKPTNADLNAVI